MTAIASTSSPVAPRGVRPTVKPTEPARRFSRPRFALLVLAGVYPLITGLLYIVLPLLAGWRIWQVTLVIAPIMVTIMIWGLIPTVQRVFHGFINPSAAR